MNEMLSMYKPSSDLIELFRVVPALALMIHTISNNEKISAAWFSIEGKNKKEITLNISDLYTERKLFRFSVCDENVFQKIVNIFSIKLTNPKAHFEYEFGIYKDDFNLS